jgi:hypothetical protein
MMGQKDHTQSSNYMKLAGQLNPEEERVNITQHISNQNSRLHQGNNHSTYVRPWQHEHTAT